MAAPAPKPVKLTQVSSGSYTGPAPEPLVVVGSVPVSTPVTLTAVPGTFADLAAVRTYLNTLVTQLQSSDAFN